MGLWSTSFQIISTNYQMPICTTSFHLASLENPVLLVAILMPNNMYHKVALENKLPFIEMQWTYESWMLLRV
jgi:hypothetical protein